KPELMNRREVTRALERRYPAALRGGNVEGAVVVVFWIDEKGAVQRYEIRKSSGSAALDAAGEEVIEIMEFRPAVDRGEPVKVIVALPIRFQLRWRRGGRRPGRRVVRHRVDGGAGRRRVGSRAATALAREVPAAAGAP